MRIGNSVKASLMQSVNDYALSTAVTDVPLMCSLKKHQQAVFRTLLFL